MIALALALATPAQPTPDPSPPYERIDDQVTKMERALAELEAKRAAEKAAKAEPSEPSPYLIDPDYTPPSPAPVPFPTPTPTNDCRGPMCVWQPRPDVEQRREAMAAAGEADTRVTPEERLAQLLPIAWALAGAALALGLWRFMRPRWRGYAAVARIIIAGYWREIGLFGMLSAIFLKLW